MRCARAANNFGFRLRKERVFVLFVPLLRRFFLRCFKKASQAKSAPFVANKAEAICLLRLGRFECNWIWRQTRLERRFACLHSRLLGLEARLATSARKWREICLSTGEERQKQRSALFARGESLSSSRLGKQSKARTADCGVLLKFEFLVCAV